MNNDIITQQQQNEIPPAMLSFVVAQKSNENNNTLDDITAQFVKDIEAQNKNENKDKPKSWWQSVKSAFNRGKTEGNGGIKGFFKGCWEATKAGWRNTNKYVKTAIGAGCLLAGPLLMPLLSGVNAGTSATSTALQSAGKFSSWSYNLSYLGYVLSHPTDTLFSSLIAPALSLVTGVGSLISGGMEVARDIVNYVFPNKCFNVAQSRWNDIIAYAKYEYKCLIKKTNKTYDINSHTFITGELSHVLRTIKTEYPYFYNSNYPDRQDKDLQVVLNEYLKSLKERASKTTSDSKNKTNVHELCNAHKLEQSKVLDNSIDVTDTDNTSFVSEDNNSHATTTIAREKKNVYDKYGWKRNNNGKTDINLSSDKNIQFPQR